MRAFACLVAVSCTYAADPQALQVASVPDGREAEAPATLLRFEENRGQLSSPEARFVARTRRMTAAIGPDGLSLALPHQHGSASGFDADRVQVSLVGAGPEVSVTGRRQLPGTVSYFVRDGVGGSLTAIPTYASVVASDPTRGIDVRYYGSEDGQLEYDIELQPNVDPATVRLRFTGAESVQVGEAGSLVIALPHTTLVQRAPVAYTTYGNSRVPVACSYAVLSGSEVAFTLGEYDHDARLVIDPVLDYSTYFGGEFFDEVTAVAVGADGSAYVTGFTYSLNLPVDDDALQPTKQGNIDAFVTRFDASGLAPIFSTYLGGTDADQAAAIAVDDDGNAYVTGWTLSDDFPVVSAAQPDLAGVGDFGIGDAFVAKLAPAGNQLAYSTYLGGGLDDEGRGIAVDDDGSVVVVGRTYSNGFPRVDPLQAALGSPGGAFPDAFIARIDPSGASLLQSSPLGGAGTDEANAVALDGQGNAYLVGYTDSQDFPTLAAFQAEGSGDAFVSSIASDGAFRLSTYLGGRGIEEAHGVAIDPRGRVVVVGETDSDDFPTAAPHQDRPGGGPSDCFDFVACRDAFVSVFDPAVSRLEFSTYYGGKGSDLAKSVAVDPLGNIHVAGNTGSVDLPTESPVQASNGGGEAGLDAFVAKFSSAGGLAAATYLGGSDVELAHGVAADSVGNAYVVGITGSNDFPTANAFQGETFGSDDGFVARIGYGGGLPRAGGPIVPDTGGDTGIVTVGVYGSGFASDARAVLRREGEADIEPLAVAVRADGGLVIGQFDLTGRARGLWDVVVEGSNGDVVYPAAFTIEAGHPPEITISIVARPRIRVGRSETVTVFYGNLGNVDAVMFPITVSGFPPDAEIEILSPTIDPPQPLADESIDWDAVPEILDDEDGRSVVVLVPRLPPDTSGILQIGLRAANEGEIDVDAEARMPHTDGRAQLVEGVTDPQIIGCWYATASGVATVAGLAVPGATCLKHVLLYVAAAPVDVYAALHEVHEGHAPVMPVTKLVVAAGAVLAECVAHESPIGKALLVAEQVVSVVDVLKACWPLFSEAAARISALNAIDPNEKVGIGSGGPRHAVVGGAPLAYQIFFENKPMASAPAQEVVVTDVLDERLDVSTLRLGQVVLGDEVREPDAMELPWSGNFDLRIDRGVVASVEASFDEDTRTLTWRFTSLDPVTGSVPEDPLLGFLPPNQSSPEGEGSVSFTIAPLPGLPSGTEIHNAASIVFDTNAPIETQVWSNVIDDEPPTSAMIADEEVVHDTKFMVRWSGTDAHAGIREYVVLAATDDGDLVEWMRTAEESAEYEGEFGHTYHFAVRAEDHAGNREEKELVSELEVRVVASTHDGCGCGSERRPSMFFSSFLLLALLRRRTGHRRRDIA